MKKHLMKGSVASLIVVALISVSFLGCLGGNGITDEAASDIVLNAEDIPGDWSEVAVPGWWGTWVGDTSEVDYAVKCYYSDELDSTLIIMVVVFDSIQEAKDMYSESQAEAPDYKSISVGDKGLIVVEDYGSWEEMIILFRKGNVLVVAWVDYWTDDPISETWFVNLMKDQAKEI